MHDRKHEHGVNVRTLGGASGGLRGCQWGWRVDRAVRRERKKKGPREVRTLTELRHSKKNQALG